MTDTSFDAATLSVSEAARLIRERSLSVEALARACLARIAARDPLVKAWSFLDPDLVIRQARELDKLPPRGPLHGIPIGVKDVIDTADMPTEHNSPLFTGHRPSLDAGAVATLRAAGALILGKTDTTEFAAAGRPAATRNPHDVRRTPGGSSSGSAAAVADFQVPLSLGTQTGGSTIRPASFCGIFGLKPSWGVVSREGIKVYSLTLDTISWYARAIDDLDLVCDVFDVHDDAAQHPVALAGARIALCRSPAWPSAEPATRHALEAAAEALRAAGAVVTELTLPPMFDGLGEMQRIIMHAEGRAAFLSLARTSPRLLHDDFHSRVENRDGTTRADLAAAYDHAALCRTAFDGIAGQYDAVLTPSAIGEAPIGTHPGDAVFNRMWTLLHVPCINIPGFHGPNGMPVGVTLTGPRYTDRHLLSVARAVAPCVAAAGRNSETYPMAEAADLG
jgi:Asp-tRNA(Asn)/Glu-tRNA(Gln) amidotransferase A subunit family amidase